MFADHNQQRVEITKALFKETGTYNDMAIRPYETQFNPQNVNLFQEATQGGMSIAPSTLSGIANQFLRPAAQGQAMVGIENGWQTARLRFLIEVVYYNFDGSPSVRKIVQGYTSHIGVGNNGSLDPQMILYFNNVITLRETLIETEHGRSLRTSVGEASHLLRGDYQANSMFGGGNPNITWMMRPQDVFTTMGRSTLSGMWGNDVMDLRTTFGDSPIKKSSRKNTSAPHYVAGVLKGYRDTTEFSDNAADLSDMMSQAAGTVKDEDMGGDKFFHQLTTQTATFSEGGTVSLGELNSVFPDFDAKAVVIMSSQVNRSTQPYELHQAGQTESWTSSNNETVWATILAQSLPSIMMDLMITQVAFVATNQTLDGQFYVNIGDVGSFSNIDMTMYVEQFTSRLKTEILRGLSSNNLADFNLTMMVDIMGETCITLSIAGGPPTEYVAPSFCDALFAPLLTNNQQHIETVAHDMQELSSNINTVHRHGSANEFQSFPQGGMNESII